MTILPRSSQPPTPTPTPTTLATLSTESPSPTPPPTQPSLQPEDEVIWMLNPDSSTLQRRGSFKGKGVDPRNMGYPIHRIRRNEPRRVDLDILKRQSTTPYPSCDNVGNEVLSCFPTSNTSVFQGEWTKFIWNSRIPDFIGDPGRVDIYLFNADSDALIQRWTDVPNAQSQVPVRVNDSFWDDRATQWQPGMQQPFTYYFIITKAGRALTGGEQRQPRWTAVQTRLPDSAISASSAAATLASISSVSLASQAAQLSSYSRSSVAATATADLQGHMSKDDNSFPSWAIALLVVLGFLALVSMTGLGYLLLRYNRRSGRSTIRQSVGSDSPIMVQTQSVDPHSPTTVGHHGSAFGHTYGGLGAGSIQPAVISPSGLTPIPIRTSSMAQSNINDGASTRSASDTGPFSTHDAAVMADAFRKALRKPDFADRPPEENDSPEQDDGDPNLHKEMISRELAEEGREIRSVSSTRGVRVEHAEGGGGSDDTVDGRKTPTLRKSS